MFYSKKLKKFNSIKHCFFSRNCGFSKGIYKSLNCGRGSKDSKKNILKNLKYVANKFNVKNNKLLLMHQTHGNKVIEITKHNYRRKIKSDAIVTRMKGFALGVVTADCVPVIIYDKKNNIIACVHAGWRGAISEIIEKTIRKIKKINFNNKIFACIGPCIGKKSYEVDFIFYKKFIEKSIGNKVYFSKKNKTKKLFNLRKYVADKLLKLNVKIDHVNYDTFSEKNNFFSFRRSQKLGENDYGRCISVISLI
jgi:YfiH family protein